MFGLMKKKKIQKIEDMLKNRLENLEKEKPDILKNAVKQSERLNKYKERIMKNILQIMDEKGLTPISGYILLRELILIMERIDPKLKLITKRMDDFLGMKNSFDYVVGDEIDKRTKGRKKK